MNENKIDLQTATAREKAIAFCIGYKDKIIQGEAPLYTEEEIKDIKKTLTTVEDIRQYNKLVNCYNVFVKIAPIWGLSYAEFRASANVLVALARRWDYLESIIEYYNSLVILWGRSEEKLKDVKNLLLLCFPVDDAKIKERADGRLTLYLKDTDETPKIINQAQRDADLCVFHLTILKSVTEAIEKWTKAKGCKAVLPAMMRDGMETAKRDYALYVGQNGLKFSKADLQKREAKGDTVTEYERLRAFFPVYNQIETDKDIIKKYTQRLKNIENEIFGE